MSRQLLIVLSIFMAGVLPLQAGPILSGSSIQGGSPDLLRSGTDESGGVHMSIAMLGADPDSPLFQVSASAVGWARIGELSVQTVAVATGAPAESGHLTASAYGSYSDTITARSPGLDGQAGYFALVWRDPPLEGMQQILNGHRNAQLCTGPCGGGGAMRVVAPGFVEIGRIPLVFGQPLDYTVALMGWAGVVWTAERQDYAYAAVTAGLDASQLYAGFTDAQGRFLPGVEWFSQNGLGYNDASPDLIHSPEPGTWALLGAGLAALGVLRRRGRRRA